MENDSKPLSRNKLNALEKEPESQLISVYTDGLRAIKDAIDQHPARPATTLPRLEEAASTVHDLNLVSAPHESIPRREYRSPREQYQRKPQATLELPQHHRPRSAPPIKPGDFIPPKKHQSSENGRYSDLQLTKYRPCQRLLLFPVFFHDCLCSCLF